MLKVDGQVRGQPGSKRIYPIRNRSLPGSILSGIETFKYILMPICDPMDCSPPGSSVCGDSPGKNTGVGCHALFQGIVPTQGSNLGLPYCRQILY